ncbi:MAG: elongation factor P maturation arginine rhamnosyltransferase EarP, partial [Methylobacillus sp.]|nr:elongation factor P maturation arginine rhamnosyltransferase EarP [Methylobacillus sp.]
MNQPAKHWDIFCAVIDNFGDIGVCWRLARQLAAEHGCMVRLWVDDVSRMQALHPEINPSLETQFACGVEVRRWVQDFPEVEPADVVIEAFGCALPMTYEHAMAARARPPVWINLEYLSAESWVEMCHALPSPHPFLKLTKYFFFPGFTDGTGNLLREADLLEQRETFRAASENFRASLGIPPPTADELLVSLFCYDSAPRADLLAQWEESEIPVRCLLPVNPHPHPNPLPQAGEGELHRTLPPRGGER